MISNAVIPLPMNATPGSVQSRTEITSASEVGPSNRNRGGRGSAQVTQATSINLIPPA